MKLVKSAQYFIILLLLGLSASQAAPLSTSDTTYGDNTWIAHAYEGDNFDSYYGCYEQTGVSFDSENLWCSNCSPSDASGYQGLAVSTDYHSVRYQRRGFPCGTYSLDIPHHDDAAALYVDGVQVWSRSSWNPNAVYEIWTGYLDEQSEVVFEWTEQAGGSDGAVDFNLTSSSQLAVSATLDCVTGTYTLTADGASNVTWSPATYLNTTSGLTVVSSPTDTLTYTASGTSVCSGASEDVSIQVYPGDGTQYFGEGEWFVACYEGDNFETYHGYYIESDLSFDSRTEWTGTGTPSDATGFVGCDISTDYHSVSYKRRGFDCGTYQIDVQGILSAAGHDDYAYLYVNDVLVWSNEGCCTSEQNVWSGALDANATVEFRWREFAGNSYGALNFTQLTTTTALDVTSELDCDNNHYVLSAGGIENITWSPATGLSSNTGSTVYATPNSATTYTVSGMNTCSGATEQTTVDVERIANPETEFGDGDWLVFAYEGNDFESYQGFSTESDLSFDSRNRWDSDAQPSDAAGYLGCEVSSNNHSVRYKRENFDCGEYEIAVTGQVTAEGNDDWAYLYIDGELVWNYEGCCVDHGVVWTGVLNESSQIEFRWREFSGGSYGALQFNQLTTDPEITVTANYECTSGETTLLASGADGYTWSPATSLNLATGDSVIATPSQEIIYTVEGTATCSGNTISSQVTVLPNHNNYTGAEFGDEEWYVFVYNGSDFDSYQGLYLQSGLDFDTRNTWDDAGAPSDAVGYAGCGVPNDAHSYIHKRQGFTCGDYQIDVSGQVTTAGHDDAAALYIDGDLVWSNVGCCQQHLDVWSGTLGPESTVEFRVSENAGNSYGALDFTFSTPSAPTEATWVGYESSDWGTNLNWKECAVPADQANITIETKSNDPVLDQSRSVGDLTLNSGTTLTLAGHELSISGNTNLSGSFQIVNERVVFDGTSVQSFNAAEETSFYDVTVDNANGMEIQTGGWSVQGSLEIQQGALTTNRLLTLASDASGSGRIGDLSNGSINGEVHWQRYVANSQKQWRYVATPMMDNQVTDWQDDLAITGEFQGTSTGTGITANASMYWYDETNDGADLLDDYAAFPQTDSAELIQNGRGYAVFFRETPEVILDHTGEIRQGDVEFELTYTNGMLAEGTGWNLLGNPYPSEIDWNAPSGWVKNQVTDALYFTDNENDQSISFVNGIAVPLNATNGIIAQGQAFWVRSLSSTASLTATEEVKTSASHYFHKSEAPAVLSIKLTEYGGRYDEGAVYFHEDATSGFDLVLDAEKFYDNKGLAVGTQSDEGTNLVINAVSSLESRSLIPLSLTFRAKSTHTIEFFGIEDLDPALRLSLFNAKTNETLPIEDGFSYEVQAQDFGVTHSDWLYLVVENENLITSSENSMETTEGLFLFPNPITNGELSVTNLVPQSATMKLMTVEGRVLEQREVTHMQTQWNVQDLAPGLYIILVEGESASQSATFVKE